MVCKAQLSYWEDIQGSTQVQESDLPKILIKVTQGFLHSSEIRRQFQKPKQNHLALNMCHRKHYLLFYLSSQGSSEPSFSMPCEGAGNGLPGFFQLCTAQSSG